MAYRLLQSTQSRVGKFTENNVLVQAYDKGTPSLTTNYNLTVQNNITCDAMRFYVSENGNVTVKSLCTVGNLNSKITQLVGKDLLLECISEGNVDVKYRWLKDGVSFSSLSESGKLVINNTKLENAGDFACIASSIAGTLQSTSTEVKIHRKLFIT